MSLEFSKLIDRVQTMGRHLRYISDNASDRFKDLLAIYRDAAGDGDTVRDRVQYVRAEVGGYRGAAPLKGIDAPLNAQIRRPPLPTAATIIAVDGSQIYPDPHSAMLYYLINLGEFVYRHGSGGAPDQTTHPELVYNETNLLDRDGRIITNQTVNARRTVAEVARLAQTAWEQRAGETPLLALHDGGLLKFFGGAEVANAQSLEDRYMEALRQLHDARAIALGYLDKPRSTYVVSLLHLLRLPQDAISEAVLKTNGDFEGLTDAMLFGRVLKPGDRSAIIAQNSPQNREYMQRNGDAHEIACFYVNVALPDATQPVIIRVDLPAWVARDAAAVKTAHALILDQCAIQGRRQYPYALTRADELAYVSGAEKAHLESLIRIEMLRQDVTPEASNKLQTKGLARADRREHRLG